MRMPNAFIYISHFLHLHKKQKKVAQGAIFLVYNFFLVHELAHLLLLSNKAFPKNR